MHHEQMNNLIRNALLMVNTLLVDLSCFNEKEPFWVPLGRNTRDLYMFTLYSN